MAKPIRTPKDVIDQAIRENRINEYLLYAASIACLLLGITAVIWGLYTKQQFAAIGGVFGPFITVPVIQATRETRRANMAIRLYELPLMNASTAEEAANVLTKIFERVFVDNGSRKEKR